MNANSRKIQWSGVMIGVVLVVISIIGFIFPLGNFLSLTWIIGLLIAINGILEIAYRRFEKKLLGISSGWIIALGILNIIFGLIVMINPLASSILFIYLFAIWFIVNALMSIFTVTPAGYGIKAFRVFSIIFNILFVIIGVILLFNPLLGAVTVSTFIAVAFLFSGLFYIVDAFDRT